MAGATCRFCGKTLAEPSSERCEHCGGRIAPPRAIDRDRPDIEAGRVVEIARREREARLFLTGLGFLLVVLWLSASMTGTSAFRTEEARRFIFYSIVVYRNVFGLVGAGLFLSGAAFWATGNIRFAQLGGLVWMMFILSPIVVALGPSGVVDFLASGEGSVRVSGRGVGFNSPLLSLAVWVIFSAIPLYHFRELARIRCGGRVSGEAED